MKIQVNGTMTATVPTAAVRRVRSSRRTVRLFPRHVLLLLPLLPLGSGALLPLLAVMPVTNNLLLAEVQVWVPVLDHGVLLLLSAHLQQCACLVFMKMIYDVDGEYSCTVQ